MSKGASKVNSKSTAGTSRGTYQDENKGKGKDKDKGPLL